MRLRKIIGADEFVEHHPRVIHPKERQDKVKKQCPPESREETGITDFSWFEKLKNGRKVYLEIGMGKGDFVLGMAKKYPEALFLGLEKYTSVLLKALQKYDRMESPQENLWFLCENAVDLPNLLPEGSLDGIYLNFSDPWPKERYAKRRLTAPSFLEIYHYLLKPEQTIAFKTDNRLLFEYSLMTIEESPYFELELVDWDLHKHISPEDNVMTEYEKKFSAQGNPIFKLVAKRVTQNT